MVASFEYQQQHQQQHNVDLSFLDNSNYGAKEIATQPPSYANWLNETNMSNTWVNEFFSNMNNIQEINAQLYNCQQPELPQNYQQTFGYDQQALNCGFQQLPYDPFPFDISEHLGK